MEHNNRVHGSCARTARHEWSITTECMAVVLELQGMNGA